jgi:PAS domain S-box-containing protein
MNEARSHIDGSPAEMRGFDPQLFRDAFNASPIGIVVEDLQGQPLFVNPAFCAFLGFTQEELSERHCVDFSPPEDAEKDWALFQKLRAGSIDHYQIEKRYFRKDGSLVWGSLSISLLNSPPSPRVIAMVEDITEKKKGEEARFRHAAVIESSDDAIASGTLDGIILTWNTGAQKIYGYTEAEAVGKPITLLVPPELPGEENRILETVKAGGRVEHFETVRVTKTGKRINVSLSLSPIKDSSGKLVGISGIARDITERKLAEEALRASEERLRLAQQAAGIGTFERDVRTGRITWAEGLEPLYGLPPGIVLGQTAAFFNDLIHPADRERTAHLIQQALKTGQPTEGEWRAIWPDGSVHWIVSRWQVLMDDSGEPSRVVGVNMDITERKLAEQTLAQMTRKLIEAQEQERARIGRELHDDINQRLAMLAVELEQLQSDPSEVHTRVRELRRQLAEISNDVQDLSHALHSSKLEYLGVVAGIKSWCKEFSERQKIEVDFRSDVYSALPREVGLTLLRVLQEALHNAAKHSGVKRIDVQLREESDEIRLIVSDFGRGFDLNTALQAKGLGLTSMRERVRLINGTISIESKPKVGTKIYVRVPLDFQQASERKAV